MENGLGVDVTSSPCRKKNRNNTVVINPFSFLSGLLLASSTDRLGVRLRRGRCCRNRGTVCPARRSRRRQRSGLHSFYNALVCRLPGAPPDCPRWSMFRSLPKHTPIHEEDVARHAAHRLWSKVVVDPSRTVLLGVRAFDVDRGKGREGDRLGLEGDVAVVDLRHFGLGTDVGHVGDVHGRQIGSHRGQHRQNFLPPCVQFWQMLSRRFFGVFAVGDPAIGRIRSTLVKHGRSALRVVEDVGPIDVHRIQLMLHRIQYGCWDRVSNQCTGLERGCGLRRCNRLFL